ncbi:transporter [Rhodobacteraceae bacterium RKSG542]|uniref:TRAP transporter substrate-binding protein DctP n=1 Tax=Pseudovibrio flavus TaxID=2529854 RepID=UPI0012BBDDCC|nr:TRAP transporter substrate-binding protein DctP [Pseudovibrio flavus]MTI17748.1 transporter [Pseudovibrio flavus]
MRKFGKLGALALTSVFLAISANSASAANLRLKLAGTVPAAHFGNAIIEEMANEIQDAGVGLKVKYFPAGQLGTSEELAEDSVRGNVDLVHGFIYAHTDPRLEIMNLPYLVSGFDEMRALYTDMSSPLNSVLNDTLDDAGLVHLSLIGEGLQGAVTTSMPENPTDLGKKDLNIRVFSSQIAKDTMESLGYQTTTLSWGEVFPSMQSGTIDGAICCTPEWAYTGFAVSDVGQYFIPYEVFIETTMIYSNQKTWKKMNDEQRTVVRKAAENAAIKYIDQAWARNQDFVTKLKEKGWEIVEFDDEERRVIVKHVRDTVWPQVEKTIGAETMKQMLGK